MVAVLERARTWTAADLAALPDDPDHRYELVEGRLVKMSPTYGAHGRRTADLHFALESYPRLPGTAAAPRRESAMSAE